MRREDEMDEINHSKVELVCAPVIKFESKMEMTKGKEFPELQREKECWAASRMFFAYNMDVSLCQTYVEHVKLGNQVKFL